MTEEWRPIPGWEGCYSASTLGRLMNVRTGHIMSCQPNVKVHGYCSAMLYRGNGERKSYRVHRLIAMTFIPNPEGKSEINHIDSNRGNNVVTNLEWATPKENRQHAVARGTSCAKTNPNFRFKLSLADVEAIKAKRANGASYLSLAKEYGVYDSHIARIISGRTRSRE